VEDRYGVSWQVMLSDVSGDEARIAPAIMFAGALHGRAEEAMRFWTSALPGGRIESIARYEKGAGPENTVMHGRFYLLGQRLVAFDSHVDPGNVAFDEGLSLQVMCRNQAEIDEAWRRLSADGGHEVECGWLRDRFGFPWQVAPESLGRLLTTGPEDARERVFAAMLKMKKLDIAALEAAARQPRAKGRPDAGREPHSERRG
jgi:predicted 3-demethylubiquinone-9 3-methyltransferase (glyoxalase superfamily)